MHDTKLELIVGVFVLVGIAALAYIAIKLGKLEVIGGGNQIEVQAEFDSVAGLKPGASVEIAGVQVGQVKRIGLKDDRALVVLSLHPGEDLRRSHRVDQDTRADRRQVRVDLAR